MSGGGLLDKKITSYKDFQFDKNAQVFVSAVYNKDAVFDSLERKGFSKWEPEKLGTYVWCPTWMGDASIPPCYEILNWEDNEVKYNMSPETAGDWDYRYRVLVSNLPDKYDSVMDCGAGSMSLKGMIKPDAKYYPIDNTSRNEETIVCDFNAGCFPNIHTDIAFLCGILEYIIDPEGFIGELASHCTSVYLSYNTLDKFPDIKTRLLKGWKNHLLVGDIIKLFHENDFEVKRHLYTDKTESFLIFAKADEINE